MASSHLFILGLAMLVVALNLVTQTEGFNACYKDTECSGDLLTVSLYNYLIIYFIIIKPVNDCDECVNAGGRSMHISLSLICKRCDIGINACFKSKKMQTSLLYRSKV